MSINGINLVQPSEGYVEWVCFLARLHEDHGSCLLEFEAPNGARRTYSLFTVLTQVEYNETLTSAKLVRAFH